MSKRIIIIGTSGAGKSTLAMNLAQKFSIPHIELDNLYWGQNWTQNSQFVEQVMQKIQQPNWVICGNYSSLRESLWSRGTHLIWLDYPFFLIFWRVFKRSLIRIIFKEHVCGDNQESFKRLFSRHSILLWVIQTFRRRKEEYTKLINTQNYKNLTKYKIKSSKEILHLINKIAKK